MNFLFWNIRGNNQIQNEIKQLCEEREVDILILAESNFAPATLLNALNKEKNDFFYAFGNEGICDKIQIFVRASVSIRPIQDAKRITARIINSKIHGEINLIALHYQSKVNWSNQDQSAHAFELKRFIDLVEENTKNLKTIVCGDFNMNPFDDGMIQTSGLHSVMEKRIALKQQRTVDDEEYLFFYNPMWGFLGDLGLGNVSGTMYFSPSKPINYHWNLFDQVLIKPALIPYFEEKKLEIITEIQSVSLLTKQFFVNKNYSDHLPIFFNFNI